MNVKNEIITYPYTQQPNKQTKLLNISYFGTVFSAFRPFGSLRRNRHLFVHSFHTCTTFSLIFAKNALFFCRAVISLILYRLLHSTVCAQSFSKRYRNSRITALLPCQLILIPSDSPRSLSLCLYMSFVLSSLACRLVNTFTCLDWLSIRKFTHCFWCFGMHFHAIPLKIICIIN